MSQRLKEENLIFIISQPRSGSTYLQNLLSNNSETNTSSEFWMLLKFANQIKPDLFDAKFDNKLATIAFRDYLDKNKSLFFNKIQKDFLLNLYQPLFQGFDFVVDKTPRYWEILEEISVLFPKSKIIILKRNPINVAKSMILTWNLNSIKDINYFKRDLLYAPKEIQSFCNKNSANPNVYCLKYEDLIQNTPKQIEMLYNMLGIEYNNSVLETSNNFKFKGRFGDPYQNSETGYSKSKAQSRNKSLSYMHHQFLKGYANYLGKNFLLEYGAYDTAGIKPSKSVTFSRFLHFRTGYDLFREFKFLLKEGFLQGLNKVFK
ncbi:sulfotransferase [uncultured Salegentibacter sp.]|uniref:sulfotransferase family protein n=1 Tax=uncultured Salegentibacter sp. TaxID=259320 RepID=UPI0025998EDB|nr:sulfotransferase [uncultured Salegentibacter sp.]